jgi:mercuric ion transport protein
MNTLHAEKWGPLGAIFAAACCLGLTWLVPLAAALGAGFLIRDSILMPLLAVFLAASIWGLSRSYRRHLWVVPLAAGSSGAALLLVGMFTARPLSYAGIALLVAAPLLDLYAQFIKERPGAANVREAE